MVIHGPESESPAETAIFGMKQLQVNYNLSKGEAILLSDSDHFFSSIFLERSLKNKIDSLHVWQTKKLVTDLGWCHLRKPTSEANEARLIEKPDNVSKVIDPSKGIVGLYFIPDYEQFLAMESFILSSGQNREIFISAVINRMLNQGPGKSRQLFVSDMGVFFPLGNDSQVESFMRANLTSERFYGAPNLLLDYDGVICLHQKGFHQNSSFASSTIIQESKSSIQRLYSQGVRISIVSSRPASLKDQVSSELKSNDIPFDDLFLGVSGSSDFD